MAEAGERIEHEDDFADLDSAQGDDATSSTASVASSVYNYQYENGRRYHAYRSGNYFMPNDEQEQERLDLAHHTHTLLLGGQLCRSELSNPRNILDVGTGTGIWAMDMADTFPDAQVIATDLSGIQPRWVPPNVHFQIDDCESDWNFNRKFDFIHLRSMGGSIADWPKLLKNVLDFLEPGGYVEVVEWETWSQTDDGSLPMDSSFQKWIETVNKASESFGKPMNIAPHLKKLVTDAGFEKVQEEALKVRLGPISCCRGALTCQRSRYHHGPRIQS